LLSTKPFDEIIKENFLTSAQVKALKARTMNPVIEQPKQAEIKMEAKQTLKWTPEGKMTGVINIKTPDNAHVALVMDTDIDTSFSYQNENCMSHATGLSFKGKIGFVMPLHVYKECKPSFLVVSKSGRVVINKTTVKGTLLIGYEALFVPIPVPGLKCYKQVKKDMPNSQLRIIHYIPNIVELTTSVSDTVRSVPELPNVFKANYNSYKGSCGAAIVDMDDHLVGIHFGTTGSDNLYTGINWELDF